jgi:hypothetical protein
MGRAIRSVAAAGLGAAVVVGGVVGAGPASAGEGSGTPAVAGAEFDPMYTHDVFEIGADHHVIGWGPSIYVPILRYDLGGEATEGVAAVLRSGRETVLTRGTDGAVWYAERNGTGAWSGWRSLGGRIVGRPAVMAVGGLSVVAVRGTDGFLYDRERNGLSWSPRWRKVGRQVRGSVALGKGRAGAAFTAYAEGSDGRLRMATRAGTSGAAWAGWTALPEAPSGGRFVNDPGADPYSTVLLIRGNDSACWAYDADGAQHWQLLGGLFTTGFAAISQQDPGSSRGIFLFGRGRNSMLYTAVLGEFTDWHRLR